MSYKNTDTCVGLPPIKEVIFYIFVAFSTLFEMTLSYLDYLFFIIIGIQLMYWLMWLIGVIKIKSVKTETATHGVSIIIAAHNEVENLKKLIPVLLKQNYSLFELIIVNDRSSDGTYDYLLEISQNNLPLQVLTVSDLPLHLNGKKFALTLGIKAAKYDQILLTDADCQPNSEQWISAFANAWKEKTSFVLGYSNYKKQQGLLNYFIRFETILTGIQYLGAAALGTPFMGVGRNLSYSKSLFLFKKGFNGFQDLTGGDDDIFVNKYANSANTEIILSSNSLITSYPKTSISTFIIQKTRHLSVGKHYSLKSKVMLGMFTLSWIATWVLLPFNLLFTQNFIPIGVLFLTRYIFMGATFALFSTKSGAKFTILGLILLDFMFVPYYFVTGIRALLIKRIKWS